MPEVVSSRCMAFIFLQKCDACRLVSVELLCVRIKDMHDPDITLWPCGGVWILGLMSTNSEEKNCVPLPNWSSHYYSARWMQIPAVECILFGGVETWKYILYSYAELFYVNQEALLWVDEVGQKEKEKVPGLKKGKYTRRHSMRKMNQCAALVVGHYCHDQLTLHDGQVVHSLGGSVSYITNVFEALGMECKVNFPWPIYFEMIIQSYKWENDF